MGEPVVRGTVAKNVVKPQQKTQCKKQEKIETSWFQDWLEDKDKVCTDGYDDGNISFKEKAKSFGKGLIGFVKTAVNHPVKTAVATAVGVGIVAAGGGAILCTAGALLGAGILFKSAIEGTEENDASAKRAWEGYGNAASVFIGSALVSTGASGSSGGSASLDLLDASRISNSAFMSIPLH